MALDLEALKVAAGQAMLAGGAWAVVDDGVDLCIHRTADDRQLARLSSQDDARELGLWGSEFDLARHIATASPTAVLTLIAEIERLREALAFYAAEDNYVDRLVTESCGCCSYHEPALIGRDGDEGQRARQALSPTPAPKED